MKKQNAAERRQAGEIRPVQTREVCQKEALEIATRHIARQTTRCIRVTSRLPRNVCIYNQSRFENCWFAMVNSERPGWLTASRLIVISRATGKIVFDGSAHDEG